MQFIHVANPYFYERKIKRHHRNLDEYSIRIVLEKNLGNNVLHVIGTRAQLNVFYRGKKL